MLDYVSAYGYHAIDGARRQITEIDKKHSTVIAPSKNRSYQTAGSIQQFYAKNPVFFEHQRCYAQIAGPDRNTIMPEKITFTVARLTALTPPSKGRTYIYDAKSPLALCVTSAGSKTYYVYKWYDGKPSRIRLGKFAELSLDAARDAAKGTIGDIAAGGDPAAMRRSRRQERTLEELWEDWLEVHAKPRKKTWQDDKRQFDKYLALMAQFAGVSCYVARGRVCC